MGDLDGQKVLSNPSVSNLVQCSKMCGGPNETSVGQPFFSRDQPFRTLFFQTDKTKPENPKTGSTWIARSVGVITPSILSSNHENHTNLTDMAGSESHHGLRNSNDGMTTPVPVCTR